MKLPVGGAGEHSPGFATNGHVQGIRDGEVLSVQEIGGNDWSAARDGGYGVEDERGSPALAFAARAEREREVERGRERDTETWWGTKTKRKSSGDSIAAADRQGDLVISGGQSRLASPAVLRPRPARNGSRYQSFSRRDRRSDDGWGGAGTDGMVAVPSPLAPGKFVQIKLVNFNAAQVVPVSNRDADWPAAATDARSLSKEAFSSHHPDAGMAVHGTAALDLGVSAGKRRSLFPGNGAVLLLRESKRKKRGRQMLVAVLFALCFFSCLFFATSDLAGPLGRAGITKYFAFGQLDVSMASRVVGMSVSRRVAMEEGGGGGRDGEGREGVEGGEGTGRLSMEKDSILGARMASIGSFMSEPMARLAGWYSSLTRMREGGKGGGMGGEGGWGGGGEGGGEGFVPLVFTDSQAESLWKDIVTGEQKRNMKPPGVDTTKRSSMKESEVRQSREVDEKNGYRYEGKEGNDNDDEVASGIAVRKGWRETGNLPDSGGSPAGADGSVGGGAGGTVTGAEISASDAATTTPATAAAGVAADAGMPVRGAAVAAGSSPAAAAAPDSVAAEAATAGAAATTASALVAGPARAAGAAAGASSAADNDVTPASIWPAGTVSAGTIVSTETTGVSARTVAIAAATDVNSAGASGGATAATADVRASRAEQALEQTVGYGEHGIDFLLIPRQDDPENVGLSLVGDQGGEAKRSTGLLVGEDQGEMESIVSGEYEKRQQLDAVWELNVEDVVAEVKGKGVGKGGKKKAGLNRKHAGDTAGKGDSTSGSGGKEGNRAPRSDVGSRGEALKPAEGTRKRVHVSEELFKVAGRKNGAKEVRIDGSKVKKDGFFMMRKGEHGKAA